jgi:putative ABC transport system permease protein
MLRYLPFILKSSMRSKRRSLLTVASAAISLCLLGTLMAIYHAFYLEEAPPQQALRVITRNRVSPAMSVPISYRNRIQQVPGVVDVMPLQYFGGIYKEPRNIFARYAVEPEHLWKTRSDLSIPGDQKRAFEREKRGCVVGRGLIRRFGFQIGDRLTLKGDVFPVNIDLVVVGIYDNPIANDVLYFRLDYLIDQVPERRRNKVFAFEILAESADAVPQICRVVDEMFRNSTAPTKTEAERAFELGFVSLLGNVKGFLISISLALTFTLLLVTANTTAISVRERVREVGILKTLGFTTPAILGIIVSESAFLTLLGGTIGCGFAWLLIFLIRKLPAIIVPLAGLRLEPVVGMLLILVGVLVGMASALVPAWGAARSPILRALRFTD